MDEEDEFTSVPQIVKYAPALFARTMHATPRFGHNKNFYMMFSKDAADRQDYLWGLIFGGCLLISIFAVWMITLLVFKCRGKDKVGFLSGAPFTKPPQVSDTEFRRPNRSRWTFLISGFLLILFGVLFVTQGLTNIRNTVTTVRSQTAEINALITEAKEIAVSLQEIGIAASTARETLVQDLGNFCPGEEDIDGVTGVNIDEYAQDAIDLLGDLGDFLKNDLEDLEIALQDGKNGLDDAEEVFTEIDLHDWQALVVLIPIILVPSFLMVGVLMAMFDATSETFTFILKWFFMPIFVLIAAGAIIGSGAMMTASSMNADWCSGDESFSESFSDNYIHEAPSPDLTIMNILNVRDFNTSDLVFKGFQFYVTQCLSPDPWEFIREYDQKLNAGNQTLVELTDSIESVGVSSLTSICGVDFLPYDALLNNMLANVKNLRDSVYSVKSLLACDRIVSIYTNLAYEGTCKYSVKGIAWMWISLGFIGTFAMIMITLRSSLQATIYFDRDEYIQEEDERYQDRDKYDRDEYIQEEDERYQDRDKYQVRN